MPSIEQYDWSKLKPQTSDTGHKRSPSPDDIYWRYKKKEAPKPTSKKHGKVKRVKVKDYTIFNETHDHFNHLRDIARGDS